MLERSALAGLPLDLFGDAVHVVRDHPFEVGCVRLTVPVPTAGHQVDDDDESLGRGLFERADLLQRGDGDPLGDVIRWDDILEGVVGHPAPTVGVPGDLLEGVEGVLLIDRHLAETERAWPSCATLVRSCGTRVGLR
ncbi:hypothetical protein ABZY68_21310 [Streptomyces sp. NPDC006482]|uniref:hypothetical protein n=1 Tax=Streptomyces sp. NPDC006482 TaxID=3154306 RepID=UPI0033BA1C20